MAPFVYSVTSTWKKIKINHAFVLCCWYFLLWGIQKPICLCSGANNNTTWKLRMGGICFHFKVSVRGLCICMSIFINWESGSCHVTICTSFSFRENAAFCCPTSSAACWPEQQCTGKTLCCLVLYPVIRRPFGWGVAWPVIGQCGESRTFFF